MQRLDPNLTSQYPKDSFEIRKFRVVGNWDKVFMIVQVNSGNLVSELVLAVLEYLEFLIHFPRYQRSHIFLPQHLRDYFSPCVPFLVQNKSIRKHTGDFYSTEPFIQTYKYFSPPFRSDSLPGSNRHGKYCKPTFHPPPLLLLNSCFHTENIQKRLLYHSPNLSACMHLIGNMKILFYSWIEIGSKPVQDQIILCVSIIVAHLVSDGVGKQ